MVDYAAELYRRAAIKAVEAIEAEIFTDSYDMSLHSGVPKELAAARSSCVVMCHFMNYITHMHGLETSAAVLNEVMKVIVSSINDSNNNGGVHTPENTTKN